MLSSTPVSCHDKEMGNSYLQKWPNIFNSNDILFSMFFTVFSKIMLIRIVTRCKEPLLS